MSPSPPPPSSPPNTACAAARTPPNNISVGSIGVKNNSDAASPKIESAIEPIPSAIEGNTPAKPASAVNSVVIIGSVIPNTNNVPTKGDNTARPNARNIRPNPNANIEYPIAASARGFVCATNGKDRPNAINASGPPAAVNANVPSAANNNPIPNGIKAYPINIIAGIAGYIIIIPIANCGSTSINSKKLGIANDITYKAAANTNTAAATINIAAAPAIIARAPTPDIMIAPISATAPTNANIDTTAIAIAPQLTFINSCTAFANTNTAAATSIMAAAPATIFFIFLPTFDTPISLTPPFGVAGAFGAAAVVLPG